VVNITGITAAGRVNFMHPSADGLSLAVHYGANAIAAPDVYAGTTMLDDSIYIVPNVGTAAAAAAVGAPLVAPNIANPAGTYLAITGMMVNTMSLGTSGAPSFDYWFASGSTNTATAAPESTLTLRRVVVDPVANTVGTASNVSTVLPAGAIIIYGSGN
jgi:hypothetical protein